MLFFQFNYTCSVHTGMRILKGLLASIFHTNVILTQKAKPCTAPGLIRNRAWSRAPKRARFFPCTVPGLNSRSNPEPCMVSTLHSARFFPCTVQGRNHARGRARSSARLNFQAISPNPEQCTVLFPESLFQCVKMAGLWCMHHP